MGRSPCCEKAHTNKGAWAEEEDQRLVAYIRDHGEGSWRSLPKAAGLARCGKSCRLRWINYLRPDLKRGKFTVEEDGIIIKLHGLLGNKWSLIAGRLPGRTDNEIKNYWNTHIKRKLLGKGIDPQTHCPLKAAAPPPPTVDNIATTTAFVPSSDDGSNIKSSEAGCSLDLNLDLSITLPNSSAEDPSPAYSDNSSTVTISPVITAAICLCYHLGFRGSEACGCQSVQEQQAGLRYCRSLEIEERDFLS